MNHQWRVNILYKIIYKLLLSASIHRDNNRRSSNSYLSTQSQLCTISSLAFNFYHNCCCFSCSACSSVIGAMCVSCKAHLKPKIQPKTYKVLSFQCTPRYLSSYNGSDIIWAVRLIHMPFQHTKYRTLEISLFRYILIDRMLLATTTEDVFSNAHQIEMRRKWIITSMRRQRLGLGIFHLFIFV